VETQVLSWENFVLRLPTEESLSQLSSERQITTQCNNEVWPTSIISGHMLGSLSVVQDTLKHTQEESLVTSGTHQATGRCQLGRFLQSSKNLLLGTCICSGRVLCPSVMPQRSHKTHRCTFKRADACYHWPPTKHNHLLLAHSIWHNLIWDKAQCFMLEALHQSPRSETSPSRNSVPKTFSETSPLQEISSLLCGIVVN